MRIEPDTPINGWSGGLLVSEARDKWWHTSVGSKSAVFREVASSSADVNRFDRLTEEGMSNLREFVDGKEYLSWAVLNRTLKINDARPRYQDTERWNDIVRRAIKVSHSEFARAESTEKTLVPTTALRTFYSILTGMTTVKLREALARQLARPEKIGQLDLLVAQAVAHIKGCPYDNRGESLVATRKDELQFFEKDQGEHVPANEFVAHVGRHGGFEVRNREELNAQYVAREVSPLRTSNGRYESGAAASTSGDGGMDLLLCSKDRRPIVGEIKASTDVGPFIALVQALTYATEMCVESQLMRCVYEDDSEPRFDATNPQVNVYLIFEGKGDTSEWNSVRIMAELLMRSQCSTPKHIGLIAAMRWDKELLGNAKPVLHEHFCFASR